jgi:hypothetical protein
MTAPTITAADEVESTAAVVVEARSIHFDRDRLAIRFPKKGGGYFDVDIRRIKTQTDFASTPVDALVKGAITGPTFQRDFNLALGDAFAWAGLSRQTWQTLEVGKEIQWPQSELLPGLVEWEEKHGLRSKPLPPPEAQDLFEIVRPEANDDSELLRHRYLCRGGGLLLVGLTGVGKSSLAMQMMISWSLGRPCFGIEPVRPIKSLLCQAENDFGDMAEMRDGVTRGLKLSESDVTAAKGMVAVAQEDSRSGFAFFTEALRPLLEKHRPDLIWVDPALSYLGGESNSQKDVGAFLRNNLNPLLREFNCAACIIHHGAKPSRGGEKSSWAAGDFAYSGAGSSEWANWARAMLLLRSIGSHSIYELRAGKRGGRLRWREADGETFAYTKLIAHSTEGICWTESTGEAATESSSRRMFTIENVMAYVPTNGSIRKDRHEQDCYEKGGIPFRSTKTLRQDAIEKGLLFEWHVRRPGKKPEVRLARQKQPENNNDMSDDNDTPKGGVSSSSSLVEAG